MSLRRQPDFNFERDMTIPATKWLINQGLMVKHEFRMTWGICDVVGLEPQHPNIALRLQSGQRRPVGPPSRIALLRELSTDAGGVGSTLSDLSQRLGWLPNRTGAELKILIERCFARETTKGRFVSVSEWRPLHQRIIAIELKLDRIDEAISQARSHTVFATDSFIALPRPVAERVVSHHDRVEQLKRSGIGLLSVSRFEVTQMFPCNADRPYETDPILQRHCVERFLPQFTSTPSSIAARRVRASWPSRSGGAAGDLFLGRKMRKAAETV